MYLPQYFLPPPLFSFRVISSSSHNLDDLTLPEQLLKFYRYIAWALCGIKSSLHLLTCLYTWYWVGEFMTIMTSFYYNIKSSTLTWCNHNKFLVITFIRECWKTCKSRREVHHLKWSKWQRSISSLWFRHTCLCWSEICNSRSCNIICIVAWTLWGLCYDLLLFLLTISSSRQISVVH